MIKPIVEGHGEVDAVPILLRRVARECFGIEPPLLKPGRYPACTLLKQENGNWIPGPNFAKAGGHAANEGAQAILTILDLDDACPKEVYQSIAPLLPGACGIECTGLVFALKEFEAWFLASVETLADDILPYPGNPESVRDAKGRLEEVLNLEFPYNAPADQPGYTARIDLFKVFQRCRSFRKFVSEYRKVLLHCGMTPSNWPA